MFWVTFVIFNVTNFVYIIWASGEVQKFDSPDYLRERKALKEKQNG